MIRLINCMKRRDDVSAEQFRNYWNDPRFTELIDRMQAMFGVKQAKKSLTLSVQANVRIRDLRGTREPYDGVLEYWWEEASALMDIADTPEGQTRASSWTSAPRPHSLRRADPHSSPLSTRMTRRTGRCRYRDIERD